MSYAETEMKIVQWAEARKIIPNSTAATQLLKGFSEMGELADATIKGDKAAIVDGVGDVMVCLIVYCALQDIDLVACMNAAYDEIKHRKGTLMPNGVFVKESPNVTNAQAQQVLNTSYRGMLDSAMLGTMKTDVIGDGRE